MSESIKSFEKSCLAMGLHLSPDQLQKRYNDYLHRLEAEKAMHPDKWNEAEEQARQQRLNDEAYKQSNTPSWQR